jgi:hypothetical protein
LTLDTMIQGRFVMREISGFLMLVWPGIPASWIVLAAAVLALSVTFAYLLHSRRGEAKAMSKCAVLSVWVHLILLGGAWLIDWFPAPFRQESGAGDISVRWIDTAEFPSDSLNPSWTAPEARPSPTEELAGEPSDAQPEQPHRDDPPRLVDSITEPTELMDQDVSELEWTQQDEVEESLGPPVTVESTSPLTLPTTIASETAFDSVNESAMLGANELSELSAEAVPANREQSSTDDSMMTEDAASILVATESAAHEDGEPSVAMEPQAPSDVSDGWQRSAARSALPLLADAPAPDPRSITASRAPHVVPGRYRGRQAAHRTQLALSRGGSLDTEAAVDASLAWLARAQDLSNGCWSAAAWQGGNETRELGESTSVIRADTALTGLALLAFLGAGETHEQGQYQAVVERGLSFLITSQSPQTGSLAGDASRYVAMYCHGIGTLALSEAFAMTGDARLRDPLERAIAFTLAAQNRNSGGWRYQPGDVGDTSQFGWQVMALVSAESSGVTIPVSAWQGARRWLRRASLGTHGGLACYSLERRIPSASMTAEALVCRAFLEPDLAPDTLQEAADYVAVHGGRADAYMDLYFTYYATLALYPLQDARWKAWNERMTIRLLATQQPSGPLQGSWDPDVTWGPTGGRVYTTAMACLCFEIYYRYLPVYELAANRGGMWNRK